MPLLLSMKTLVEEGPQIDRGTVFLWDTCHCEIFQRNIRDKRLPHEACSNQGDVELQKYIVTSNEEEDEDTLVEKGPQIDRGTVFLRDTRHREIHQRNKSDKRFPREACRDQGDVKVEKDIVTFNEEEDEERHSRGRTTLLFSGVRSPKRFSGSRLENELFYRS